MPTAEAELPAEAHSARAARRFVAGALSDWQAAPEYETNAALLLSELVTNAVLHARTGVTVRIMLNDHVLRLEVDDGSPRLPFRRHYSLRATTGRGLALVDSLSRRWGVESRGDGKTIWCELDASAAMPELSDDVDLADFPDLEDTGTASGGTHPAGAGNGYERQSARDHAA
jgi:anti-sigma regulatory factor (Ser/Thr protein kinase)